MDEEKKQGAGGKERRRMKNARVLNNSASVAPPPSPPLHHRHTEYKHLKDRSLRKIYEGSCDDKIKYIRVITFGRRARGRRRAVLQYKKIV